MENQDIKWETWGEQPQENNDQPQANWGEQPQQQQPQQQQNWGEQPQQQPQQQQPNWDGQTINWEEQNNNIDTPSDGDVQEWISESPSDENTGYDFQDTTDVEGWNSQVSLLGLLPKLKVEALLYKINKNNELAIKEIEDAGYEKLDKDGRHQIKYRPNTELSEILSIIKNVGENRGMKLLHSFLYKNEPKESTINIARGECKYNYIYFLQGDYKSGEVVLDFSAINGPSEQVIETTPGILLMLPGWVPYSISKNESEKDMIAIAGRFVAP
jgi:hypothetical protein